MTALHAPLGAVALPGLGLAESQAYAALVHQRSTTTAEAAALLGVAEDEAATVLDRLVASGLALRREGVVVAVAPSRGLARLLAEESRRLRERQEELDGVRRLVPELDAAHRASRRPPARQHAVETVEIRDVVAAVQALASETSGDLLWVRPDQWRLPEGRAADVWVQDLLRRGRRSRVLYPWRVLEEAPEVVRGRAVLGERVRILADIPGRLAVIGDAAVVMPGRFDAPDAALMILRQPAVVRLATDLFESLWSRGLGVPGLTDDPAPGTSVRALLLDQLGRGAKDEQIARSLGLGLRTVRRRVAELMDELGAESRFQAGAEAVRRGWI